MSVFVSIMYFCCIFVVDGCEPHYAHLVKDYNDLKISQNVLWTMNNKTKPTCIEECYREKHCLSVHFSAQGPVCLALRERFDGISVSTAGVPGYRLFQTAKRKCAITLTVACLEFWNAFEV